jgi:uncharacterized membrane protein (TIGR01666 family)
MNYRKKIRHFIYSHYFTDGLKISVGIVLPALLFAQLGQFLLGITISLGALCVSIVDNPGPAVHKRNAMLYTNVFIFLTAIVTGLLSRYPVLAGLEIFLLCFFFSMFNVFGNRASAVGTAALVVMVLQLDEQRDLEASIENALQLVLGGLWYLLFSLSLLQIRPYRLAQQSLAECITELAVYLRLKAGFYQQKTSIEKQYTKLIAQQVVVHEKQDVVRELLFQDRIIKDPNQYGRQLIMVLVDMIDLFEESMATLYDYQSLREKYGHTKALKAIHKTLKSLADELDHLSGKLLSEEEMRPSRDFLKELNQLKAHIDDVETSYGLPNLVLKKILINIRNMIRRTEKVYSYFGNLQEESIQIRSQKDLPRFVSHQDFDLKLFREHFSFDSAIFRHSLRVAIVCLIGYAVSKLFPLGHYSYWILLTIIVIMKPSFSLTKQRNYERIVGTLIGGLLGVAIIVLIKDDAIRFALLLLCMVGAYSFQRLNYKISVLFLTPYLLILFSFLGENNFMVAKERIIDTLVGSSIAFLASYFVFPNWEYRQMKSAMRQALIANYRYCFKLAEAIHGKSWDITDYKLIRKEVYLSSANLGSSFQRMLSEPKRKQGPSKNISKFTVLNHLLSSYIANLSSVLQGEKEHEMNSLHIKWVRKCLFNLQAAIQALENPQDEVFVAEYPEIPAFFEPVKPEDWNEHLLNEQLQLCYKLTQDLRKLAEGFR